MSELSFNLYASRDVSAIALEVLTEQGLTIESPVGDVFMESAQPTAGHVSLILNLTSFFEMVGAGIVGGMLSEAGKDLYKQLKATLSRAGAAIVPAYEAIRDRGGRPSMFSIHVHVGGLKFTYHVPGMDQAFAISQIPDDIDKRRNVPVQFPEHNHIFWGYGRWHTRDDYIELEAACVPSTRDDHALSRAFVQSVARWKAQSLRRGRRRARHGVIPIGGDFGRLDMLIHFSVALILAGGAPFKTCDPRSFLNGTRSSRAGLIFSDLEAAPPRTYVQCERHACGGSHTSPRPLSYSRAGL